MERLLTWQRTEALVHTGHVGRNPYTYQNGALQGQITAGGDHIGTTVNALTPAQGRPNLQGISSSTRLDISRNFMGGAIGLSDSMTTPMNHSVQGFVGVLLDQQDDIARWPWTQKAQIILELMRGATAQHLADLISNGVFQTNQQPIAPEMVQRYVQRIIHAAWQAGQLPLVIGVVDAFGVLRMMNDQRRQEIEDIFVDVYYPNIGLSNATNQIIKWIDYEGPSTGSERKLYRVQEKSVLPKILQKIHAQGRNFYA